MNTTAGHRTAFKSRVVLTGSARERLSLLRDAPALVARMVALGLAKHNRVPDQRPPKGKTAK